MTDVFIKTDEGDDIYVIFQTEKAKETSGQIKIRLNGEEDIPVIFSWAISHSLSVKSELPIKIGEHENK